MAVALANVKTAIGLSSATVYDAELTGLIAGAEADLKLAGVVIYQDTDQLIIDAVAAYCQGNRGTDADVRSKFLKMYKDKKRNLMLASEYTEVAG